MRQLFLVIFLLPAFAYCQEERTIDNERKLGLVVGIGFPDAGHLGLNYSLKDLTLGASLGRKVVNGEVAFQFGRKSLYLDRSVFYWSQRLSYHFQKGRSALLIGALGKNFYLEKNFGINIDIGVMAQIYYMEDETNCAPECDGTGLTGIYPSARLQFFFKLF